CQRAAPFALTMTVADPIACAPIRLAARPPVRSQLGRLAQVDMFQLALRLRGIEVEQDADAARQPVGHGDFRGAEQRHVAPPEESRRAGAGGATIVQVRHKGAPAREVAALARALVGALPVPVLVNDRVDVALAAGAAGAHLGQDDPPLDAVRPHVPPGFLLGASVGSPAEADRVRPWPADYWSVGPCYATDNKPDAGSPLGPDGFARLARLAPAGVP